MKACGLDLEFRTRNERAELEPKMFDCNEPAKLQNGPGMTIDAEDSQDDTVAPDQIQDVMAKNDSSGSKMDVGFGQLEDEMGNNLVFDQESIH